MKMNEMSKLSSNNVDIEIDITSSNEKLVETNVSSNTSVELNKLNKDNDKNDIVINDNELENNSINSKKSNKNKNKNVFVKKFNNRNYRKRIKTELIFLSKFAIPIAISEFLKSFLYIVSNIFVGQIGATELASIALANSFCASTGWYVIIGIGTAIDTLCSQAYTAAKTNEDKKILGQILQRAVLILYILCIPISILWIFSEKIFLLLGQDEDVSRMANKYTTYMIFALFPYVLFEYSRRFIQAQGITKPQFYMVAIVTPVNILLHYIFIFSGISPLSEENRYLGAAVTLIIIYVLLALMMMIYIKRSKANKYLGKLNLKVACKGIGKLLKLGIPGMFMVLSEMIAYEVFSIIAGIIGKIELAAQSVVVSICSSIFNFILGISIAACVRIGNLLGAGDRKMARFSSNVSIAFSLSIAVINSMIILIFRKLLVRIFSSDSQVNKLAASVLLIICAFELTDGLIATSNGILRGCGRQKVGAIMNIITYWVGGIPLGIVFTFIFDMGLYGVWFALMISFLIMGTLQIIIIQRTNWKKQCDIAKSRYEKQKL